MSPATPADCLQHLRLLVTPVDGRKYQILRNACKATCAICVILLLAGPAAAAKPASFALWEAHWEVESDKAIGQPVHACGKLFAKDDAKAGACAVKVALAAYAKEIPIWSRQVAAVSIGQAAPCRRAIHSYWLATRKVTAAAQIYFRGHSHVTATRLGEDLRGEPFKTLGSLHDAAKSRAIRICG